MVSRKVSNTVLPSLDFSVDTKKVLVSLPTDIGITLGAMEDKTADLCYCLGQAFCFSGVVHLIGKSGFGPVSMALMAVGLEDRSKMRLLSIPVIQTMIWEESTGVGHGLRVLVELSLEDISDTSVSAGNIEEIVPAGLIFKGPLEPVLSVGFTGVMESVGLTVPMVILDTLCGVEASMGEYMILLCFSGLRPPVTVATGEKWGLSGGCTWSCLHNDYPCWSA